MDAIEIAFAKHQTAMSDDVSLSLAEVSCEPGLVVDLGECDYVFSGAMYVCKYISMYMYICTYTYSL